MKNSFIPLYVTNFFGTLNDNFLKTLAGFTVIGWIADERVKSLAMGVTAGALVLPYILCSPLADRLTAVWEKKKIVRIAKWAELPIMAVAVAGFALKSPWLVIGAVLFLIGYAMCLESLREKNWIIREGCEVEDLNIVDTGIHGYIRQPLYASMILMFMGIPLILGSLLGFFLSLVCAALIVLRIITWEKVLEEGLPGFKEYEDIIKFRLIPFVW